MGWEETAMFGKNAQIGYLGLWRNPLKSEKLETKAVFWDSTSLNRLPNITIVFIRFDLEDAFSRIGRVRDVWVARKPPGFAFIEMEVSYNTI